MTGKSFDIASGIFWFFKCVAGRPFGALWIALWQAIIGSAIAGLILYLMLPAMAGFADTVVQLESGMMSEEEGGFAILGSVLTMLAAGSWGVILGLLAALAFQGAWLRFLVRGEIAPIIPFRLGGDEVRLLGVNLLYFGVAIAAYIGVGFALATIGITGGGIIAVSGDNTAIGAAGFGLVMFFGSLALIASMIFISVKLSTAPALTIHDRKFRFFQSWEATNGVFWPMLLSYIAVGAIIMIVGSIIGGIIQLAFLGAMIPVIEDLVVLAETGPDPDFETVMGLIKSALSETSVMVTLGIGILLSYVLQIVYEGMWHSVAAYNAIRHRDGSTIDEGDAPVLGDDSPLGRSPSEG